MKRLLLILCFTLLASPVLAADRLYIYLGPNHPDYDPATPKKVSSGFLDIGQMRAMYPEGEYQVLTKPLEGASDYRVLPVSDKLNALFMAQPAEVRAGLYPLKAAVKVALEDGDMEAVKLIIKLTPVPEELEAERQKMMEVLK